MTPRQRQELRRRRAGTVSQDRWLVSYADFITLLFAFFTTMYAMSTVDGRKLGAMVTGLQVAFEAPAVVRTNARAAAPPAVVRIGDGDGVLEATLNDVRARLAVRLGRELADGRVTLTSDHRGLVISLREAGSFESGSAVLSETARRAVSEIAAPLRQIGNAVRVEGHTDDRPIHTVRFASNWELSTARATAVVAVMVGEGIAPTQLSAAGYGEFHPALPNDSEETRARNRRVDVIVLNPATQAAEEPR
jgi:chemotaxis protein MotB